MLNIVYFAWIKERMNRSGESIPLPPGVQTVAGLAQYLRDRDETGAHAFSHPILVRAAVNQDFAEADASIRDGDEVAFFPPVTGG